MYLGSRDAERGRQATKEVWHNNSGHQTAQEAAEMIVRMALIGVDGPTGGFFDVNGPLPW
ncbi:hypothetical protein [Nocardia sp. NPDC059228]|uniref:hypothetical protein n=1 Tax=Nocardia sp. NPDC059228 TaxID=3346777 RepID=UPI00368134D1